MWRRVSKGAAAATAAVAMAGAVLVGVACACSTPVFGGGGGGGGGGGLPDPSVWVSTTGNNTTCVRLDDTKPCLTLDRAYQIAQCGDVVSIANGSYGEQLIVERPGAQCVDRITLAGTTSAVFGLIRLGSGQGGPTADGPDMLTVDGISVDGVYTFADTTFVTFNNIEGGGIRISAGNDIVFQNSDLGPCWSSGPNQNCSTFFSRQIVVENGVDNVSLIDNVIHDYYLVGPDDHYECIRMDGARDFVVRGNHFYNCEIYAMTTTKPEGTWLIENNWFGYSTSGGAGLIGPRGSAIVTGDNPFGGTVIVRFNSFAPGEGIADEGATPGGWTVVGNILGHSSCANAVTYNYNYFTSGGGCGTNITTGSNPYLNADGRGAANYHLSGAAGSTGADNLVPTSVANSGLSTDWDDAARPAGTNRDAGSDER